MKREQEIKKEALSNCNDIAGEADYKSTAAYEGFIQGAEWADETMIERACKCFCDDICEKSRCGMCFHKYDGEYNVKVTFKYNECLYLGLIRKSMIGDKL